MLAPWHHGVKDAAPGVSTWAYIDDRSTKFPASSPDAAVADAFTVVFDAVVGLGGNVAKRQDWQGDDAVEHLGIVAKPNVAAPAQPRSGWDAVFALASRLIQVPGSISLRTNLTWLVRFFAQATHS